MDDVSLYVAGQWRQGGGKPIAVTNPATEETIFSVATADRGDLDAALSAADAGFHAWRRVPPFERSKILRTAADLLRQRRDRIAEILVAEQGKTLGEAKAELDSSADIIDWFAEEGRRAYGRSIPARLAHVQQLVRREPIGPVAAFTPWNFPVSQAVRKVAAALAAGCSIILKGPEETPGSCSAAIGALHDAGVPSGAISLLFGVPSEISEYLIPHPVVRKVSFTGSTAVGKKLAALAGANMKPITLELGGHAPAIVFEDADALSASKLLAAAKFRNAGQVCISPTRILVHEQHYTQFVDDFCRAAAAIKVGAGSDPASGMGAMANARRIEAMSMLVADAVANGATVRQGGARLGNRGYFFEPTVLTDVPTAARAMNEEPFGPLALIAPFSSIDEALAEANRLRYGLAAYAYTKSFKTAQAAAAGIESGMLSINHHGLGLAEIPFGGVKDSGYGSENGQEGLDAYLVTKLVTMASM